MIAVIHKNGTSFKGLMAYLLTGKDGNEPERVEFTHTVNLAAEDPNVAWKSMLATTRMQDDLKKQAGVRPGKRSAECVTHITLSYSKGEDISREEMIAAAEGALTYLGVAEGEKLNKKQRAKRTQYADQHQAIIVAHNDQEHPHCHVVVNRVHPEHGVMLPENKNFEKLSAWALDLRRSMGMEHLCPQRAINAAKRAQGYLTSHPRRPQNVFERDQELATAEPGSRKKAHLEEQRRRAKQLKVKSVENKAKWNQARRELSDRYDAERKASRAKTAENIRRAKAKIKTAYSPKIDAMHERQAAERKAFHEAKATLSGRVGNAWSALKTKAWMTDLRRDPIKATSQAFGLAFSAGLQERQLDRQHTAERRRLAGERIGKERSAAARERGKLDQATAKQRDQYTLDRGDLELKACMETAKVKAEWRQLRSDRKQTMREEERSPRLQDGQGSGGRGHGVTKAEINRALEHLKRRDVQVDVGPPDTDKLTERVLKKLKDKQQKTEEDDRRRGPRR